MLLRMPLEKPLGKAPDKVMGIHYKGQEIVGERGKEIHYQFKMWEWSLWESGNNQKGILRMQHCRAKLLGLMRVPTSQCHLWRVIAGGTKKLNRKIDYHGILSFFNFLFFHHQISDHFLQPNFELFHRWGPQTREDGGLDEMMAHLAVWQRAFWRFCGKIGDWQWAFMWA